MMHGRGKSDSAIVAGKPTNKAGQPAAEPVEQRAEAKGNANQQSTRRAQDRESVSQALERIRQVARQRKKERFTRRIEDLHARVQRGAYRALPSRRQYIPKADGQQRPLAVAALKFENCHGLIWRLANSVEVSLVEARVRPVVL